MPALEKGVSPTPEVKVLHDLTNDDLKRMADTIEGSIREVPDQWDPLSGISVVTITSVTDSSMYIISDLFLGKVRQIAINSAIGRVTPNLPAVIFGDHSITFVEPADRTVSVIRISADEISFRQIPEHRLDPDLQPALELTRQGR